MNRAVIVFSGFNQRAVVAFLRTLEKNQTQYAIIASSDADTIFKTKYKDRVVATRQQYKLDRDDILSCIQTVKTQNNFESCMVAPSSEALNRFFLDNRELFSEINVEIPIVDRDLYVKISDKESFGRLCQSYGIPVPGEYSSLESAVLPCVAKPKKYTSLNGGVYSPVLLHTSEDVEEFRRIYDVDSFYYQEFIAGDSLYLLYYFYKNGSVSKYSQQNLVQQPGGKSILAAVSSTYHETTDSGKYENMLKEVGFHGLVMIEVKVADKSYMIEANPRFWGPSQLFVDAGSNFFDDLLVDNGFLSGKEESPIKTGVKYFWHGGLRQSGLDGVALHGISKEEFSSGTDEWLTNDVYNREDTKELYRTEIE